MSSNSILALALLAAGTLLHGNDADAQPHQPPPQWKDEAGPPVESDVWLRRLVGRFSVEGMVHVPSFGECGAPQIIHPCETIKGMVDCVGVGAGPGVQCVFNVSWLDISALDGTSVPGGMSYLNLAMVLFGLDPGHAAINHLLLDNHGLAEGGLGTNTGNRATFRTSCVNQPGIPGGLRADLPHRSQSRLIAPVHVDRRPDGSRPAGRSAGLQHHTVTAACRAG